MGNLVWKYVKPLKDDLTLETFAAEYNVELPQDIISCIKENNGGRPDKKVFDTEVSEGRVFKSLLSFNKDDLETIYDTIDILKSTQSNLVPVASDPGGNYICFDIKAKNIVLWLHETNTIEKISDTFTAFLDSLYS